MAELTNFQAVQGFVITRKVGNPTDPDPMGVFGIYQVRTTKLRGKRSIKMKFYQPPPSRTARQAFERDRLRAAVAAWQILEPEDKAEYNRRAQKKPYFGYQLFIKEFKAIHLFDRLYGKFFYGWNHYGAISSIDLRNYGNFKYGKARFGRV